MGHRVIYSDSLLRQRRDNTTARKKLEKISKKVVVLSRCCLNNESEYIIPHCTCQHYFSNFLHKLSPATSIPHKQGIFAMFLFCFLLFYKERKLLSELFHQICQIVIFIQTCKYSAVSGIIYDHLAQGSQVSEDIKCVYCPNN